MPHLKNFLSLLMVQSTNDTRIEKKNGSRRVLLLAHQADTSWKAFPARESTLCACLVIGTVP
jgi:hypothetical protein